MISDSLLIVFLPRANRIRKSTVAFDILGTRQDSQNLLSKSLTFHLLTMLQRAAKSQASPLPTNSEEAREES